MTTTTCPSHDELHAYSIGLLSDEASDAVAVHLASCVECRAGLSTLDGVEDTFLAQLRRPAVADPYLEESQCQVAVARACDLSQPSPDSRSSHSFCVKALGEYQLIGKLGRGGMGTVYKALQTKLDRVVAVKVLSHGRVENRQAIARFEREMRAVGKISHPNAVQAYDAREIDDMPVLIMEFVDGFDLADIVRRVGKVPVAEACELVRRTALGLQCAHEHGLVHRDIKPSNIMLTAAGEVKLLDLGLARLYAEGGAGVPPAPAGDEMTGTGQAMGTADYMAPEQASDSRTVDIRADLYSLGCTLYKLLSGRAPFSGPEFRSTLDKLNAHVHQPVLPIRTFSPDVPEKLAAILDRMLAKDPGERFASPAEVAAALEPFCKGANLADLMVRAMAAENRSSHGEGDAEGQVSLNERAMERDSSPRFRRPVLRRILLGLGFFGAMSAAFAAGIVITIKRSGSTSQLVVPDNARTDINDKGNATVNILGDQGTTKASASDNQSQAATSAPDMPDEAKHSIVKAYRVTGISPESALQILRPVFAGAPEVRLTVDTKTGSLVALARPAQQNVIQTVLKEICSPRTVRFHFHNQPWKDVLEWVAHEADVSLVTDKSWPEGTLNYTDDREFTPDEAIDLLNSLLLSKNYTLTRTPGALTLRSLDHGRPSKGIPTVREDTLDESGDHEFVCVVFHVGNASFEKLKPRLTPLLSRHGAWTWTGRELVVIDLASHVRKFRDAIKEIQATAAKPDASKLVPTTPPEVTVVQPIVRDVSDYLDFTGRTVVAKTAEIRARVTGELVKVHIKPGMSVKQGDLLMEIDPRLYQAELDQSSNLVKQAKIRLGARTRELKRVQDLVPTHALSETQLDQTVSERAEVEAAVQTAEAALEVARLRLEYTRIAASFAGIISGPVLDEGNLATADKTVLATITSIDPLHLDFQMDEASLVAIRRKGNDKSDPVLSLPVVCSLAGDKGYPYRAKMDFVESHADPATGAISCRAMLANKDGLLIPGMFVRVRLITNPPHKALLVPDRVIGSDQGLKYVLVVSDQNVVEHRAVTTGALQDDGMRIVTEGLKAEDWVITSGLQRVQSGMTVKPQKPPATVPPSSSQGKLPAASSAVELKVYGGKSFDQWRELARTDLNHDTRAKAFQDLDEIQGKPKPQVKPDRVDPDAAKPDQTSPPKAKVGREISSAAKIRRQAVPA
ncbi:MAG: efflux RND transporter periplasmic adaptor subunit [Thermoguttaceae bacterium]